MHDMTSSEPDHTREEPPPPVDMTPAPSAAGVEDTNVNRSDAQTIDPEDTEVVLHAFAGMVRSARDAVRTVQSNPHYSAVTGVTAVEDTVAAWLGSASVCFRTRATTPSMAAGQCAKYSSISPMPVPRWAMPATSTLLQ
jgi:hypothetical protein